MKSNTTSNVLVKVTSWIPEKHAMRCDAITRFPNKIDTIIFRRHIMDGFLRTWQRLQSHVIEICGKLQSLTKTRVTLIMHTTFYSLYRRIVNQSFIYMNHLLITWIVNQMNAVHQTCTIWHEACAVPFDFLKREIFSLFRKHKRDRMWANIWIFIGVCTEETLWFDMLEIFAWKICKNLHRAIVNNSGWPYILYQSLEYLLSTQTKRFHWIELMCNFVLRS